MSDTILDDAKFATFLKAADFLIPARAPMPAFSAACGREAVERSLRFRPDIHEEISRGLAALRNAGDIEAGLARLNAEDNAAFNAIGLIAAGTYYMQPAVRDAIGYPGQENVPYEALATPPYLLDGSLGQVIARGRKYRPTPGLETTPHQDNREE
jgi:hypothetical protein